MAANTPTPAQATEVARILRADSDFYSILGIDSLASHQDIKKAYKRISLLAHPDKNGHTNATEAFALVNNAYDTLGDVGKRAGYDGQRLAERFASAAGAGAGMGGFRGNAYTGGPNRPHRPPPRQYYRSPPPPPQYWPPPPSPPRRRAPPGSWRPSPGPPPTTPPRPQSHQPPPETPSGPTTPPPPSPPRRRAPPNSWRFNPPPPVFTSFRDQPGGATSPNDFSAHTPSPSYYDDSPPRPARKTPIIPATWNYFEYQDFLDREKRKAEGARKASTETTEAEEGAEAEEGGEGQEGEGKEYGRDDQWTF